MKVTIAKGSIRSLGDATISASDKGKGDTTYSYIEMISGEVFKKVRVPFGLDGKLKAVSNDDYVEIHLVSDAYVVAIKDSSGRTYSIEPSNSFLFIYLWSIIIGLFGALILAASVESGKGSDYFFSAMALLAAFGLWKLASHNKFIKNHINSLPGVIKI